MSSNAFFAYCLVLLSGFLLFHPSISQSNPSTPTYYTVDSNLAYTWNRGYPQSCTCAQGGVKKTECDLFRCSCICDVTAGVCDYNCCCDVDCSDNQKSRFDSLNACENQGFETTDIQHCYSSNELYGINPREPLGGQPTAQEAVGDALCVVQKNTAIPEEFYDAAELESSSVFSTSDGQKPFSYLQSDLTALSSDGNYDQNDSIAAFIKSDTYGLVSNGPGYVQIPRPDFAGICNDMNYATFENRVAAQSCARTLSTVSNVFVAQCEEQFSLSRYVTDLYFGRQANILASNGDPTLAETENVTLSAVYFEDLLTGSLAEITADWTDRSCRTQAYTGSPSLNAAGVDVNSNCSFSDVDTLTTLEESAALCQGFVKAVYYTVTHSTSTAAPISSITATVTLTDAPMTLSQDDTSMNATDTVVTITQTFAIDFASADTTEVSSDNGNQVKRYRSGNPGYLLGMPVLYGDLSSGVIKELVEGFTVPSAFSPFDADHPETFGLSRCPQSSSYASVSGVNAGTTQVHFGYDMTSGCSVQLNRSALIDLCCAGKSDCTGTAHTSVYSDSTTGIPYFYNFTERYVGIYGDADPLDATQWAAMSYSVADDVRIWNDATSTCTSMFNGMEIQFLVAATGSKSNPQSKIISSVAKITTADWKMSLPPDDSVSTQTFPLSITVSFVFQDEVNSRGYLVPAPPVLFKVPYDVFYPFLNSAPTTHSYTSVYITILVSTLCTVWLVV